MTTGWKYFTSVTSYIEATVSHRLSTHHDASLGSLAPLGPDTNQTANGTRNANNAIIQISIAQGRNRGHQIAEIGSKLDTSGRALPTSNSVSLMSRTRQRMRNVMGEEGKGGA